MASNLFKAGTDFDSIFAAIGSFTARAAVGIFTAGVDIASRYAPAVYGTPAANVNFVSTTAGSDVGPLFAAIGTTGGYSGGLNAAVIVAGVEWGFIISFAGSVSPTSFRAFPIQDLYSNTTTNTTVFTIAGLSSNPGSNLFTTLKINAVTFTSSSATYGYSGGTATWTWTGSPINSPISYTVTIT